MPISGTALCTLPLCRMVGFLSDRCRKGEDFFLCGLNSPKDTRDLSSAHDGNPVAKPQQLRQVGRDNDDCHPLQCKAVDKLVDLIFRADVDACSGLVKDQKPGSCEKPACQHNLLPVPAAEGLDV